jgi:glycosyltransferase involved in cell wall biosynthesis
MKKVLLITDVDFWERCSGHRIRISALIEYLANNVDLTVVKAGPAPQNIETRLKASINAEFFILEKTKFLNSNAYGRRLKAFLKGKKFDTIIIEYIHCSYFLNFLTDEAQVILDAHDTISDRTDEFKKYNSIGVAPDAYYEMSREVEFDIFNIYDNVMLLCQPDYEKISAIINDKALLCPHPEITHNYQARKEVKNISYMASSYLPNIDAITFFLEKCWPILSSKYDIRLRIYGSICDKINLLLPENVILCGFVADQNAIYEDADIIINPVRFGAGLKIKNIEALAHGLPLVTTTHGARGMEAGKSDAFLVADDAEGFVQGISSLIENVNLRIKLSENAHLFIKNNFSAEKCFAPLLKAINIGDQES